MRMIQNVFKIMIKSTTFLELFQVEQPPEGLL